MPPVYCLEGRGVDLVREPVARWITREEQEIEPLESGEPLFF